MSVQKRISERVAEAKVRSYYKPWKKRWWGKASIAFLVFAAICVLYFAYLLINSVGHINRGQIFNQEAGWITEEQYAENQKIAADILTDDDPWRGAEQPLINIVSYDSLGCPYCKEDQEILDRVMTKFGPIVRLTAKDFPTEGLHPGAFEAHLAAGCAFDQERYWDYRRAVFEAQTEDGFTREQLKGIAKDIGLNTRIFDECLDEDLYNNEIRQDYAMGVQAGVVGTPSYVVNGTLLEGSISYELWEQVIGFIIKGEY